MRYLVVAMLALVCWNPGCAGYPGNETDAGFNDDVDIYPPEFWDPGDKPKACGYGDGGTCQESLD